MLLFAVSAIALSSCKKELPSVKVDKVSGVPVNYSYISDIVMAGTDTVHVGDRVPVGTELTITVRPAEEGYLPRSYKSLKVNGGEELGGPGVTSVTYKVKASDKVVSIMTECVGGIIELEYKEGNLFVCELTKEGEIGNDISNGTHLKIGQPLVLMSFKEGVPFTDLKINGESMMGKLKFIAGGEITLYKVPKLIDKVKIEAFYGAPSPSGVALTFGADVKVDGKASGDAVNVSDKLKIAPVDAGKVFEELKINGNVIADAAGKESYEYTVPADATKVEIVATVKAKATPITLTFDKTVVKVGTLEPNAQVNAGDKLTITPAVAGKVFEELKINGNEIAEAAGKASYEYTVKADDTEVKIEAKLKAKATPIKLTFDKTAVKVGTLEPNAQVNAGDKLTITPAEADKVFEELKINGNVIAAAAGKESYEYTVPADATKVEIVATVKAKATPITLTFDKTVVKVGTLEPNAQVNAGDKLTITPAVAGKVFEELKINGNEIAEAAGKASYEYTVKADDTEVKIEAKLKAKATPIKLTFDKTAVKVGTLEPNAQVNAGDNLTITPAETGKKFAELKINGTAITEAVDKDSFTYTVKADDPKVEIVATLK